MANKTNVDTPLLYCKCFCQANVTFLLTYQIKEHEAYSLHLECCTKNHAVKACY